MKKAILLVVPLLFSFAYAQPQLQVGSVHAPAGGRVIVPIVLSQSQTVSGLQFRLSFDADALTVPQAEPALAGDQFADHSIITSPGPGRIDVFIFSASLSNLKEDPGTVAQLVFQTAASLQPGVNLALAVSQTQAYSADGQDIALAGSPGAILITEAGGNLTAPVEGQNRRLFPQLAVGTFASGAMRFTVMLANQTEAMVSGRVRLHGQDGAAFAVKLEDGREGSEFDFQLGPKGSASLAALAEGDLRVGYAIMEATGPTTGTLVLSLLDDQSVASSEIGVLASSARKSFKVAPQFLKDEADTGVALANPSAETAAGQIILRDLSGTERERVDLTLLAGEQRALFISELFPSLQEDGEFLGVAEIVFNKSIAVLGLRQNSKQFLTTIPVF